MSAIEDSLALELAKAKGEIVNLQDELAKATKRNKKQFAQKVQDELAKFDEIIKVKQASIADAERREKEARKRYEAASAKATAAEMRNNRLVSVKDKLISISADVYDLADDAGDLSEGEHQQWVKVRKHFLEGYNILGQILGEA